METGKRRLEPGDRGPASSLNVGDRFTLIGGADAKEHQITQDLDSHLEYDGRPNKRLSKDTMVTRIGEHDPGERTASVVASLKQAVKGLEYSGDVSKWSVDVSDVVSRAASYGMSDVILSLEKLGKQGSAVFSKTRSQHGKMAADSLNNAVKRRWAADVGVVVKMMEQELMENVNSDVLRELVRAVLKASDE